MYNSEQYLFHLNGTDLSETVNHGKTHLFSFEVFRFTSCNKNKIKITLELIFLAYSSECCSYNSSGTVSLNCVSDFFACCNTDTANTHTVLV